MEQTAVTSKPKIRHKTFTYHTQLKWKGNRTGVLQSRGKPEFRVASPPEFKGEDGLWTPEDLFVASVDICTMTTFMSFAQHQNLPLVAYNSRVQGILEFTDGQYQFTRIILLPTIVVETSKAVQQAKKILADAHKECIISNSIKAEILLEPNIKSVGINGDSHAVWRNPNV